MSSWRAKTILIFIDSINKPTMRKKILRSALMLMSFWLLGMNQGAAQDLVYKPVSPTFGGDALNYNGLISMATAQNGFTDPNLVDPFNQDPLEEFNQSLQRQILNQLSRELIGGQLGDDFLSEGGVTQVGNFQVNVSEGLEGLSVILTDLNNGGTTQLTIPFF